MKSLLRSPTAQMAGAKVETLYTKDGLPAKVGERAYRKTPSGKMVLQSQTINQQIEMEEPRVKQPTSQLTLLPADSHASLSVLPGSERARKMTARSGRNISGLYKKSDPVGLLVKMCLESSTWNSTLCFLTWKVKVTPAKRLLFQLVPSTPRIDETGCGLLPQMLKTPSTVECEGGIMEIRDGANAHYKLRDQIAMLPTPKSQNANFPGEHGQGGKDLQTTVHGTNRGLKLQPAFVEWLMGYPIGYTDLKHLETP